MISFSFEDDKYATPKQRISFIATKHKRKRSKTSYLGKQSNRGSGGEFSIQSRKLIETEIGKRDTNGEE